MNYEEWSAWVNIRILCPWVNSSYFIIIIIIIIINIIKIKRLITVCLILDEYEEWSPWVNIYVPGSTQDIIIIIN